MRADCLVLIITQRHNQKLIQNGKDKVSVLKELPNTQTHRHFALQALPNALKGCVSMEAHAL
mgnify:CR=1 FL=1